MASITIIANGYTGHITFDEMSEADAHATLARFIARKATPLTADATPEEAGQYVVDEAVAELVRYIEQEAGIVRLVELKAETEHIEARAQRESKLWTRPVKEVAPEVEIEAIRAQARTDATMM